VASEPQKIKLTLSAQAERYARSDAPREARLMAARGALPLPPIEIASVLFALLHDPDPEVKTLAGESLASLPDGVCNAVLSGPAHPALLSYLARVFADEEGRLEVIALNPASDDRTIAFLAARPFKRVVEIVANNQERMLRAPEIVDALGSNPLTGRAVIDRILSFLGEEPSEDAARGEINDSDAEAALRAVLGDEFGGYASELIQESDDESDSRNTNLYALIQKMSVFQKIKLARLGNREARGLLVRDRNKVVAIAAITNPKITDNEAVGVAQSRNVHDEVLRIVSNNREWTRKYQVKLALAMNPKCAPPTAMKFVNHLHERDLMTIMRSKDVARAIATHARRILMKKGKI
jgi:hypothetical protein